MQHGTQTDIDWRVSLLPSNKDPADLLATASPSADRELEGDSLGTHEGRYSSISKDGDCGDSDAARARGRAPLPVCYSLVDHLTEMYEKGWNQSGCEYDTDEIRLKHGEGMRVSWAWNDLPDQKQKEIVTRADIWSGVRHQTEWFTNYYTLRYLREDVETGDRKEIFRTSVANVGRPWGRPSIDIDNKDDFTQFPLRHDQKVLEKTLMFSKHKGTRASNSVSGAGDDSTNKGADTGNSPTQKGRRRGLFGLGKRK